VTAVLEQTETTPEVEAAAPNNLAGWCIRAAAFTVDVLPGVVVTATMLLVWLAVPQGGAAWWLCVCVIATVILLTLIDRVVWPANRGWSLGRARMGIVVVGPDGTSPGLGRLLLRDLAHLVVDTIPLFVGWLWPLWDARRRTFADVLLGTEVRRVEPDERPRNIGPLIAIVVSTAVLLSACGAAALSFDVVYLQDRRSDQTRAAIEAQGPKIVAELLTYDPKSLNQDFARAQSLTTEQYRPQLVLQQDSVRRGNPQVNEYRVTNSAVLSAAPDRARMLLFLEGHRGGGNDERLISATVRVSFVKSSDGRWLVDDLTVVTRPKPPRGER
jgi:Mce-associated membrane protein